MKKIKTKNRKYPLKIVVGNGKITIPKQSEFGNQWLKKHGCSLMAEYIALQYLGIHKWPIHLLKWHRVHTPGDIRAKVTVKGVSKGINQIAGQGHAAYYKAAKENRIEAALKAGSMVILEQGSPIHSVVLVRDKGSTYMISYGAVKQVSVASIAKTATKNATYRGMVVVKK